MQARCGSHTRPFPASSGFSGLVCTVVPGPQLPGLPALLQESCTARRFRLYLRTGVGGRSGLLSLISKRRGGFEEPTESLARPCSAQRGLWQARRISEGLRPAGIVFESE